MKNKFLFLLLGIILISFASAYSPLLSPSEIKSGNVVATTLNGTYDELYGWWYLPQYNSTQIINNALWVTWFNDDRYCDVAHLHTDDWASPNMTYNSMVTDEFSQVGLVISMGTNETRMEQFYKTLSLINGSSAGTLPSWRIKRNDTAIINNPVNDTASDADARIIMALYNGANNTYFSSTNRSKYFALANQMAKDFVAYDLLRANTFSSLGQGNITYFLASGRNARDGGFSSNNFVYTGYFQDAIIAMTQAYINTGNATYLAIAKNLTLNYLEASKYTNNFTTSTGKAFKWTNTTGLPVPSCTDTCSPIQWDGVDAPRIYGLGEVEYWFNLTGNNFSILSGYMNLWRTQYMRNTNSVPLQFYPNGSIATGTSNQSGYFAQGIESLGLMGYWNLTAYNETVRNAIGHADSTPKSMDYATCMGVYGQAFSMKSLGVAIGRNLASFTLSSSSSNINVVLNTPTDGSSVYSLTNLLNASSSSANNIINSSLWMKIDSGSWTLNETAFYPSSSVYSLDIYANSLNTSLFNTDTVNITFLRTGVWRLNSTSSGYNLQRAKVMKLLFYGTDGTNYKVTTIQGLSRLVSNSRDDEGKNAFMYNLDTSSQGYTLTGTFSTTTNNNITIWSKIVGTTAGNNWEYNLEVPSQILINIPLRASSLTLDYIGTTSYNNTNNPVNFTLTGGDASVGVTTAHKLLVLSRGNISWGLSGSASTNFSNFKENYNIPTIEYMGNTTTEIFNKTFSIGQNTITWNVQTCIDDNTCSFAPSNYTFIIDSNNITITSYAPSNNSIQLTYTPILFNWTSSIPFANLYNTSLWINGVRNETIVISGYSNTTSTSKIFSNTGLYTYIIEACTLTACTNTSTYNFNVSNYRVNSVTYLSPVLSGQYISISANISTSTSLDSIYLVYNGTSYTPSVSLVGTDYIVTNYLNAPAVSSNQNVTFYYTPTISLVSYNTSSYIQSITFIYVNTTCAGNYQFVNITNYNEETLASMNGTVEYYLSILSNSGTLLSTLNGSANGTNIALCSNINLSNQYALYSLQLRYYATGFNYETYNIQESNMTNIPIVIPLYFLDNSSGTKFKIMYSDFYYLTHPNALIQVQRQYLSQNVYNVVELPEIGSDGLAYASFNQNNVRYKIIVIEDGVTIDTFENQFPVCQSVVLGTCELTLRGAESTSTTVVEDFSYTLQNQNGSLILTYTIPSGTPKSILFATNQSSRFMDSVSTCNTSVFGSGGTIDCPYNTTVGESIVDIQISGSGITSLYGQVLIPEDLSSFFLLNNWFIAFILLLALVLMFISSVIMMMIVAGIGVVYLGIIFLIKGSSLTTIATSIIWLLLAIVIAIYDISKKEDRS